MKKIILTFCAVTMLLIGCDTPPPEYDHNMDGWTLWASGMVDKAFIDIDGKIRKFIVEFEGNQKVETNKFYNFNDIVDGTEGSVYKWPSPNTGDYFMWVPRDESTSVKRSVVAKKLFDVLSPPPELEKALASRIKVDAATMEPTPTKYEWHSATHQPPDTDQTVVLEFEDGLLTIGYYTRTKEYKSDVGRRKMSGGIALKNVVRWKLIDLE